MNYPHPMDDTTGFSDGSEDQELAEAISLTNNPHVITASDSRTSKALLIVKILANTPPTEWLSKKKIHAALAEFRSANKGAADHVGETKIEPEDWSK